MPISKLVALFVMCFFVNNVTAHLAAQKAMTIDELITMAVCFSAERPGRDLCLDDESRARREKVREEVFLLDDSLESSVDTGLMSFGSLPLNKPERDDSYERLSATVEKYCLLGASEGYDNHPVPKKVQRLLDKGRTPELKDWFKEFRKFQEVRSRRYETLLFAVKFENLMQQKSDLSEMQVSCAFLGEQYGYKNVIYKFAAREEFLRKHLSDGVRDLIDQARNRITPLFREQQSKVSDLKSLKSRQQQVISDIGENRGAHKDFTELDYPVGKEEKSRLPLDLKQGRFESESEFQERIKRLRLSSGKETYVMWEGEPDYDLAKNAFTSRYFCDKDQKSFEGSKRTNSIFTGQNVFGVKRTVDEVTYNWREHRISSDGFNKLDYLNAYFDKFNVFVPFDIGEAKKLGPVEAYCIVEYFPDWPGSFGVSTTTTEPTFSKPEREIETTRWTRAYPVSWVLQDLDSGKVLFQASFEMNAEEIEDARKAHAMLPGFKSRLSSLDDIEELLMERGN